ncbi:protein mono-ADP-ribosyltransferase PARP14-like [Watersipora subatra]|uniref:protein mono-ADP-ribosyltransferase PARP14-like n=1 Tax=Watersipora subatra TaxID=2589382 RepID=UPI00355B3B5C
MEGQAFTSSAGSLKCKKVIHAVGPRWRNGYSQEEFLLFQCIDSCMDEAEKHRLQSIAIPPVSTGIFGFPLNKAVKNIIDVVETRVKQGEYLPCRIVFVDNKDNSLDLFERELSSRFQARQAKSPLPRSGLNVKKVATKSNKFTVTGSNINILNRINVEIRKGDMSNSQEEALVNSVGNDFNLSAGKVSKAISAMAGPQLQAACSAHGPLRSGDVAETDGFQLSCQKVFHCNCPSYQGTFALQNLIRIVGKCLTMASSHNHQSIAFPALGTGNLRYPEAEVAKTMIEAVLEYADGNPNSSLKDVKIVIYYLDHKTQRAFDGELERLSGAGAASATGAQHSTNVKRDLRPVEQDSILLGGFDTLDKLPWQKRGSHKSVGDGRGTIKGSVKVNDVTVNVIEGDITAHSADVLVNSTDSNLNIQGRVTQALWAKAGPAARQEIQQLRSQSVQDGIWVSSGGNLSAQYIFHVNAQSFSGFNDEWKKLLSSCLEKCDGNGLTSIAFPAHGTGAMEANPKEMAKVIMQAILKYLSDNPHSLLQRIDVVIYQSEMVDSFVSSMKKCIEKRESWWTRLVVTVSDWFQGVSSSDYPAQQDPYQQPKGRRVSHHMDAQSSLKSELKLEIYGNTNADIESCKEDINLKLRNALSTIMWRDKPTYMEDRDNISKLSEPQLERLQTEARKLNVKLVVDKRLCNIKMVGLNRQLIMMSDFIVRELKWIEKKIHDKKDEVLIARAIQWKYEDSSAEWVNFDNVTNKALEETYIKNPQAVFKYQTNIGEATLDLSKMEGILHFEKFKIARKDLSKPQGLEMPSHWATPLDTYSEENLVPGTPEYQEVEKNFMATLGAGGNAVLEIKRVQNPTLYQHYIILRKDVAKRLGKTERQVEHSPLWHGTAEDTVSFITTGKFDRGLSGRNATVLGCGSYFAKNTSYSAQNTYSRPNAQGHKYIIQTRVITGEYCKGSKRMRAAPYKPNKPTEQYDSVVDNPNNPFIFVVFHDASAYPDYIIKFQ